MNIIFECEYCGECIDLGRDTYFMIEGQHFACECCGPVVLKESMITWKEEGF